MSMIVDMEFPVDTISIGGEFVVALLIISLIIALLLRHTKYWDEYRSNILETCNRPLLLLLIAIAVFKIMRVIMMIKWR